MERTSQTLELHISPASLAVTVSDASSQAKNAPSVAELELNPNPCQEYSVDAVFADPASDWDGDTLLNAAELYSGLDPCVVNQIPSSAETQVEQGAVVPTGSTTSRIVDEDLTTAGEDFTAAEDAAENDAAENDVVENLNPCPAYGIDSVFADPDGDWDADRVSNLVEFDNLLDPCTFDASAASQVADIAPTASASDSGVLV